MRLICIRHIETNLNKEGLLQGSIDISIDKSYINQKIFFQNLDLINQFKPKCVFTSNLIRTKETAEVYGFNNYISDKNLNEYNFGKYEGLKKDLFVKDNFDLWFFKFKNSEIGEGYSSLNLRIFNFLKSLDNDETYIIFSHGLILRFLVSLSLNLDRNLINQINVKNNSVHILEINNKEIQQ
jgi:alpha-ribazole phosphatase